MTSPAPRIGIVVTDAAFYSDEDPDHDTPVLLDALRARGAAAEAVVWHDDTVDLAAFDLLAIRSPWDYPERPDEFQAWLERAAASTRVVNAPATMRWNLDKHYLADLEGAGIRVVPTAYADSVDDVRAALAAHDRVVVKPAVSAGARDTGLFDADDERALDLATRIIEAGDTAMIQPEVPELSRGWEKALYLIDGRFTHAISKGALLEVGGGLIGGVYEEHPEQVPAYDDEIAFATAVVQAVQAVTGGPLPLYARVDTVRSRAYGLALLEVELVEPALNLHVAPHVTDAVVDALLTAARGGAS
ncbi:RimK family alpha-L-glutamate ligase [Microbacterium laevaniformans]|uniref:ATP-grasp domain-containing protein n=1 Tax=Microbacterium laevaniformans TaxID=36807 RepID=UPI0025FDD9B6|nr:hypothetical protein [uncultured Microbacterium sp.]